MKRQYYLDSLRIIAILVVFLFHCCRFFDSDDWHVKNASSSQVANCMTYLLVQWMMPLFFFISGGSTWYALQSKTGAQFTSDRIKRIGLPLLMGIFLLSPHQVYLERLTHGQFHGSFFSFFPHYFSGWYAFGGNFAWMGLHLWYLLLLLLFSFLLLPYLILLKTKRGRQAAPATAGAVTAGTAASATTTAIYAPVRTTQGAPAPATAGAVTTAPAAATAGAVTATPAQTTQKGLYIFLYFILCISVLALPGCLLSPDGVPGMRVWGGWSLPEHLLVFILGYYTFSRADIAGFWLRYRYAFLCAMIGLTALSMYLFTHHIFYNFGTGGYILKIALRSAVCFSWIFTLLGFAEARLNRTDRMLRYCNEAVLPFYVLHQPVIILIGYFVVQTQWSAGIKYAVIALSSFLVIMLAYEYLVRRSAPLRFLLGMGNRQNPNRQNHNRQNRGLDQSTGAVNPQIS